MPDEESICCEFIGKTKDDIDKCIYYLNYVGLSDARLYYTQFKYLSDSQRFRASIAYTFLQYKCASSPDRIFGIVIDEFLSTLDRETAKSIAYLIQKISRQKKIKLLLASAHNDLVEYVNPDLIIRGEAFPERFSIQNKCSPKEIYYKIDKCNKEQYAESRLGELHYKGKYVGGTKEFFVAKLIHTNKEIGFLVSVVVGKDKENKRRIARVVVHPSYRGIGVGTELVKKFIEYAKKNKIKN
jgi:ABC-type ATPase with predicted acetyltransferase domain